MSQLFDKAKIIGNVNPDRFLAEIADYPELWSEITIRQDYKDSAHKDTESIFLRWSKGLNVSSAFNELTAIDYPAATKLKNCYKLAQEVGRLVEATELGKVIIAKLKPNGFITKHSDMGVYADKFERFHVVLKSKEGNSFDIAEESFKMNEGEIWVINHKQEHSVVNNSSSDRIHLIIDCVAPNYRKDRP